MNDPYQAEVVNEPDYEDDPEFDGWCERNQIDVEGIFNAYESGMGDGLENRTDKINPYTQDCYKQAYNYGRELGESRFLTRMKSVVPYA